MKCARCKSETSEDYHSVCQECKDEVYLFGDENNNKMWRGAGLLINTEYTQEDLESLADAPAYQEHIVEVIMAMKFKEQFILNLDKKIDILTLMENNKEIKRELDLKIKQ
jgi:hypothetical protein